MFDLAQFLPYLLNRAGTRLAVDFGREIQGLGVGVQEWRVMAALASHGPQRLSDLAALTSIDLSTLSRLVGRMTKSGLTERARADGDRREVRIGLSARGTRTTRAIIPTAQRYEQVALGGLSAADSRKLKQLLVKVYANLDGLPRSG